MSIGGQGVQHDVDPGRSGPVEQGAKGRFMLPRRFFRRDVLGLYEVKIALGDGHLVGKLPHDHPRIALAVGKRHPALITHEEMGLAPGKGGGVGWLGQGTVEFRRRSVAG